MSSPVQEDEAMMLAFTPDDLQRIGVPIGVVLGILIGLWLIQRDKKRK